MGANTMTHRIPSLQVPTDTQLRPSYCTLACKQNTARCTKGTWETASLWRSGIKLRQVSNCSCSIALYFQVLDLQILGDKLLPHMFREAISWVVLSSDLVVS